LRFSEEIYKVDTDSDCMVNLKRDSEYQKKVKAYRF